MISDAPIAGEQEIEREVRFAVVIYGGVSLAIYINGIVQEMLHLVRSTWIQNANELTAVEKVYRALACVVGAPPPKAGPAGSPMRRRETRPGKAALRAEHSSIGDVISNPDAPLHTRFVVDILSGTSAGGINAVYLAKALVNNLSIDSLARMWITDADLDLLLNDKQIKPNELQQVPPPSLLSGRWMYQQLLKALDAMNLPEGKEPARSATELVKDLDLYCTATDLRGLEVKIALTDESVPERRFRNFFHFKRRVGVSDVVDSDFTEEMDPFLAFAARCTSSFPFAFEPMELNDILRVLEDRKHFGRYRPKKDPCQGALALFGDGVGKLDGAERFASICSVYQSVEASEQIGFSERPFGDGGYLDNKPFTYAIETLKQRHADLPVDRKLIYIEPSPEKFGQMTGRNGIAGNSRPNAVENSLDALVVLPRYETIRQDIESVIDWNANISRLQRVLEHIDPAIASGVHANALAFESYWRLRCSGAVDQLACRLAEAIRVDPSSAEGQAMRSITSEWRDREFTLRLGQQQFLDRFDFDHCERALRFLRTRIQSVLKGKENASALRTLSGITSRFMGLSNRRLALALPSQVAFDCWTQYLKFIVDPKFAAVGLGEAQLLYGDNADRRVLPPPSAIAGLLSATDGGRDGRVKWLFDDTNDTTKVLQFSRTDIARMGSLVSFKAIVDSIEVQIRDHFESVALAGRCPDDPDIAGSAATPLQYLWLCLTPLFREVSVPPADADKLFEQQDVVVYPITFGTALGEFEPVDIFRISPEDTTPIANTAPPGCETPSPKLRGETLGAFGGFLDRDWRLGDMLRGRLDGAERLITAVLPDSDARTAAAREELIARAQEAIAGEWESFVKRLNLDQSATQESRAKKQASDRSGDSNGERDATTAQQRGSGRSNWKDRLSATWEQFKHRVAWKRNKSFSREGDGK